MDPFGVSLQNLKNRLLGKYSVGPKGVYEDRDFGDYTPSINKEAVSIIEELEIHVAELKDRLRNKDTELNDRDKAIRFFMEWHKWDDKKTSGGHDRQYCKDYLENKSTIEQVLKDG